MTQKRQEVHTGVCSVQEGSRDSPGIQIHVYPAQERSRDPPGRAQGGSRTAEFEDFSVSAPNAA